jgi:hypothetical protein
MHVLVGSWFSKKLKCCIIVCGLCGMLKINYMAEGIRLALEGQVEKNSDVLGRNAVSTCQYP